MRFAFLILILSQVVFAQTEQTKPTPMREISVIVTKEGYYPKSLSVFEGEKIKFYVTSTVEESVFDRAGEFAFYCPGSKNDGKIVVIRKVVAQPKREVASDKNEPAVWMPKEY
jgi:hypothetical protein